MSNTCPEQLDNFSCFPPKDRNKGRLQLDPKPISDFVWEYTACEQAIPDRSPQLLHTALQAVRDILLILLSVIK